MTRSKMVKGHRFPPEIIQLFFTERQHARCVPLSLQEQRGMNFSS
jgi:hypothetical protein